MPEKLCHQRDRICTLVFSFLKQLTFNEEENNILKVVFIFLIV